MIENKNINIFNRLANKVDDFVGLFSPFAAAKRRYFRFIAQNMLGSYRGTEGDRFRGSWLTSSGSADYDLLNNLPKLRERSRDLVRNDGIASGAADTITTNIIGSGIKPQSRLDKESLKVDEEYADKLQKQIEKIWERWCPSCDAGGRQNYYEMEELSERNRLINGESIIIPLRIIKSKRRRPYFLALQSVEADRMSTPSDLTSNKNIRAGVELGEYGEPEAYYIRNTHPGDWIYAIPVSAISKNFIRYPALNDLGDPNILHLYHVKRSGQTRGEPFFSPVINLFHDRGEYMEAELFAARVAACFAVFIKKNLAEQYGVSRSEKNTAGKRIEELSPGLLEYLEPGEDITAFNPNRPGNTFNSFMERILRDISSGLNLPYEIVSKDFSKSNYSNTRAALIEARRFFMMQQRFVADKFGQPVLMALLEEAYLRGELPILDFYTNRDAYVRSRWIAPGWNWIDPQNEVTAAKDSVSSNLSTMADEVASQGQDWEEVLEQRAREEKKINDLEKQYKIKLHADQVPAPAVNNNKNNNKPDPNNKQPTDANPQD